MKSSISLSELQQRAKRLSARLACCDLCPRECHVNRLEQESGFCHSQALPIVASYCTHHGEEPAISGNHGSGTIFFANCNLRCVYCQNFQISQNHKKHKSHEVSIETLAKYMLELQARDCHNINLVSPSHFAAQILEALAVALPQGFNLPLVYNTNAYDSLKTLKELDGIVDIYLPDIKYASDDMAIKYSSGRNYPRIAREAIKEMFRQVGNLIVNDKGVAQSGVIVRHLILPSDIAGTEASLKWLAQEVSKDITVSLMSQYHPTHRSKDYVKLSRPITTAEYETALYHLEEAGLENGWVQELDAVSNYLPDFEREGHPFEAAD